MLLHAARNRSPPSTRSKGWSTNRKTMMLFLASCPIVFPWTRLHLRRYLQSSCLVGCWELWPLDPSRQNGDAFLRCASRVSSICLEQLLRPSQEASSSWFSVACLLVSELERRLSLSLFT